MTKFTGSQTGVGPLAGLIRDPAGNFYGTASGVFNAYGKGTVFKLSP
jgi:uncharacterized repeat protein (TIGR03803 family)